MIDAIRSRIGHISRSAGLEIIIHDDGLYTMNYLVFEVVKNTITRKNLHENILHLEQFETIALKDTPIFLYINGKGILTKSFPFELKISSPLKHILPEANPEDFYAVEYVEGKLKIISASRKSTIDNLVDSISRRGFKILAVNMGIAGIQHIIGHLNTEQQTALQCSLFSLKLNKDNEIEFLDTVAGKKEAPLITPEYLFNTQYYKPSHILPLAGALTLITEGAEISHSIHNTVVVISCREFLEARKLKFLGMAAGIVLTLLLLINAIAFVTFFNKNERENIALSQQQAYFDKQNANQKIILHQKATLTKLGWSKPSKYSYFIDRIASRTPLDITLTALSVNKSLNETTGNNISKAAGNNKITLQGLCDSPTIIDQYVNNLSEIKGVKSVQLKRIESSYHFDKPLFYVEISL